MLHTPLNERIQVWAIWCVIGVMACLVAMDLMFLRKPINQVTVEDVYLRKPLKGRGHICELLLKHYDGTVEQRSVDEDICNQTQKGELVTIVRTRLLDRWVDLKHQDSRSIGILIENRILTDIAYVLLAGILPFVFSRNLKKESRQTNLIVGLFILELIGAVYYAGIIFG